MTPHRLCRRTLTPLSGPAATLPAGAEDEILRAMEEYSIRATYDDRTIRVYQAYGPDVANAAIAAQTFVGPFKRSRMTWIKPSFNWMMYRSGYATKPGQEVVLAIDITRCGFTWALENAVLSAYTPRIHGSREAWRQLLRTKPVRIQWDPERDSRLRPINGSRAIQVGLSGEAVGKYVEEWVVQISDVTYAAARMRRAAAAGDLLVQSPADSERPYPMPSSVASTILPV